MIDCEFVFVGIAECGCIRAICADVPGMAESIGDMVIGGMKVEKRPAPQSFTKNPECPTHNNKPKGLTA